MTGEAVRRSTKASRPLLSEIWRYWLRIPGRLDICRGGGGDALPQTDQSHEVCSLILPIR